MDFEAFYDAYWQQQGDQFDQRRQSLLTRYIQPGDQVLQVDCGPGVLAARLVGLGAQVVGTDLSAEAVRRAQSRGINASQLNLDRQPLPFADASFDVVVSDSQIEHRVDYARYLDECVRVLRPGGRLVLCVPNAAHWRVRWWVLRGHFPYVEHTPYRLAAPALFRPARSAPAAPGARPGHRAGRRQRQPVGARALSRLAARRAGQPGLRGPDALAAHAVRA